MRFVGRKQPEIRTATTSSCIFKSGSNDDSLFLASWPLDKTGAGGRRYTLNREQYTPAKISMIMVAPFRDSLTCRMQYCTHLPSSESRPKMAGHRHLTGTLPHYAKKR